MKKTLAVGVAGSALIWLWFNPLPAGANTFKTTLNKAGAISRTAPFQAFGNFTVGDCQYETAANLILAYWPKSQITTAEVESAYNTYGIGWDPDGLEAGQDFLISTGFAGHHASSITEITQAQAVTAANNGGVEVTVLGPTMAHIFAIVQANAEGLTEVDDGFVYHYTWSQLNAAYTIGITNGELTPNGNVLTFYAVTWN
jgi:hypothetical protein